MKRKIIKICESNECAKHHDQLLEVLSNYDQIEIVYEKCLNRCSFCEDTPYVMINNGIEFGDDMEELLENIEESLFDNRKK